MITNKTFDEINIGDTASLERTLTKNDVDVFALLTGDMNPTHFSDEYAQMLLENQKISGHAMWGGSLISTLLGNDLPGPGTVYKSQQLDFHKSVALGDTLTISIKVKEKLAKTEHIVFDCLAVNQNGDTVITGIARVRAPAKQASGPGLRPEDMVLHPKHVFETLIKTCSDLRPVSVAVCHPCGRAALLGPLEAAEKGLIIPVLVGPKSRIKAVAEKAGVDISPYEIVDTNHSEQSAIQAVALCRNGKTEALMKGSLHTDEMMRQVAKRETGLRTDRRISHVFIMNVLTYPRPIFITDAAINIYPDLNDKIDIIKNAIDMAHALGIAEPKVAILSAVETVNAKISSTIDAAALCKMADRGQITGALLDGPLAFDNAVSKEAAMIKGIDSPVAGQADILVAPDLESGNILAKQLIYLTKADGAGIVLGARVPIILTSRADSTEARLASCAVAATLAHSRRRTLLKKGGEI